MLINTEKLLAGYLERVKTQYPDMTIEELSTICRTPFVFLKLQMKKITLPIVRFKYFGSFLVYKQRISNASRIAQHALENDKITQTKFNKIQLLIENNNEGQN